MPDRFGNNLYKYSVFGWRRQFMHGFHGSFRHPGASNARFRFVSPSAFKSKITFRHFISPGSVDSLSQKRCNTEISQGFSGFPGNEHPRVPSGGTPRFFDSLERFPENCYRRTFRIRPQREIPVRANGWFSLSVCTGITPFPSLFPRRPHFPAGSRKAFLSF